MNEVTIFENPEFGKIRITMIGDEPYFVGKDVTEILGYSNSRKALADHVDEEDKGVTKCDTLGGTQEMTVINESGLYSLILGSKLPKAKKFKHWVTSEVLPAIRKTGSYSITDNSYSNADMALLKIVKAGTAEERALAVSEYHEIVVKPLEDKIEEQKPLVDVAKKRISNKGCYTITDVTKSLNFKRGYITRWAKAKGYLHQSLNEVNKAGEKFFKVYSTDFIHNSIGITEEGLQFIKSHIAEIYDLNSKEKV